jgi:hypothetical protein
MCVKVIVFCPKMHLVSTSTSRWVIIWLTSSYTDVPRFTRPLLMCFERIYIFFFSVLRNTLAVPLFYDRLCGLVM